MSPCSFPHRIRLLVEQSPRWVVGVAVVTPAVALMQGVALLQNYRKHHLNIPYPVTPSQGLVVSVDERTHGNHSQKTHQSFLNRQKHNPPLRLLVIGDSLAAGVGVMHRATPVLPESIARTLSQKLGGRPVYWTCIGKPGASLADIIQEIETDQRGGNVRLLHRHTTIREESLSSPSPSSLWSEVIAEQRDSFRQQRQRLADWWLDRRQKHKALQTRHSDSEEKPETSTNPDLRSRVVLWWGLLREDVKTFRHAWSGVKGANNSDNSVDDDDDDSRLAIADPFKLWQQWKRRLQRRKSLLPANEVSQYDIAVVLTGANDIKHAWLPFMMTTTPADSGLSATQSVQERLQTVVDTLRSRMEQVLSDRKQEAKHDASNQNDQIQTGVITADDGETSAPRSPPVVVFPAIPISLVPQLHSPPMSWFVFAVFRRLENYKKAIAEKFPGVVVFVETPPMDLFDEIQDNKGELYEDRQAEEVLLKLTNVTQRVQEQFERKLKEYREKWARLLTEDQETSAASESAGNDNEVGHPDESYPDYEQGSTGTADDPIHKRRSFVLSLDQIHPNDEGYDIWGRHIAGEVLKQWKIEGSRQ